MKLIDDIRRENIARLVDEAGSLKGLADRLQRQDSQVSQWLHGSAHSVTGKPRGMRSETARMIEKTMNKPVGWLDIDHTQQQGMPQSVAEPQGTYVLREAATSSDLFETLAEALSSLPPGLRPVAGKLLETMASSPEDPDVKESLEHLLNSPQVRRPG